MKETKMTDKKEKYHHGDLRSALLTAGEAVLATTGRHGFSLRQVAREVGVSHSAPAHHFGDANGLLMAMAADGFRRFLQAMVKRQVGLAQDDHAGLLVASGLGYLDFARSAPALFLLMFNDASKGNATAEVKDAGDASFGHIVNDIHRLRGVSPFDDHDAMVHVMAAWSTAHGFANLLLAGRMYPVQALSVRDQEAFFVQLFEPLTHPRYGKPAGDRI